MSFTAIEVFLFRIAQGLDKLDSSGICIFDSQAAGLQNRSSSEGCYKNIMKDFAGEFVFAGRANIASVKAMAEETGSYSNEMMEFISNDGHCAILSSSRLEESSTAFYDDSSQTLTLTRDMPGREPVFYSAIDDRIIFATNIKALVKHPNLTGKPNNKIVTHYISIIYNNKSFTAYKKIRSLQPGNRAEIDIKGRIEILNYHDMSVDTQGDSKLPDDEYQLAKLVKDKICQAVADNYSSEYQTGILLSGGINSAALLAAVCENRPAEKVRTFTVNFEGSKIDSNSAARLLANHFGTDHTELKISDDPEGLSGWITENYDQPFADPAAIKTFLISQAVRKYVPSVISGEGGKLIFAGHRRYRWLSNAKNLSPMKSFACRLGGSVANILAPENEHNRFRLLAKFAKILPLPPAEQYFMLQSLFSPMDLLKLMNPDFLSENEIYVDDPFEWFCKLFEQSDTDDPVVCAQLVDIQTYLPQNILTRTNTTSKATGLDIKLPFICQELIKLGVTLPTGIKCSTKENESILYKAFKESLPADTLICKRKPLTPPLSAWLRNELRHKMLETLTNPQFQDLEIFYPPALAALVNEHLCKQADHSRRLWAITILAQWLIKNA